MHVLKEKHFETLAKPLKAIQYSSIHLLDTEKNLELWATNAHLLLRYKLSTIKLVLIALLLASLVLGWHAESAILFIVSIPTLINMAFVNNNYSRAIAVTEMYQVYQIAKNSDASRSLDILARANYLRNYTTLFKPFIKNLL